MIRLLVALFVASVATADGTPVRTVTTYADGRRVVIETVAVPVTTVQTRQTVLVEEPLPVLRAAPVVYTSGPILYAQTPVLLAAPAPVVVRRGLFGRLYVVR